MNTENTQTAVVNATGNQPNTPVRGRVPKLYDFVTSYLDKVSEKGKVGLRNRLQSADIAKTIESLNALKVEAMAREIAAANAAVAEAQAKADAIKAQVAPAEVTA